MKKTNFALVIFSLLFAAAGSALAGAFIISFQVKSENDNVVLEWSAKDENGLDFYAIERRTYKTEFLRLPDKIFPNSNGNGVNSYRFVDRSAYKTSDNVYIYRLAIVNKDGSVNHSGESSVLHNNVSGVKRTWGSIKAMFR